MPLSRSNTASRATRKATYRSPGTLPFGPSQPRPPTFMCCCAVRGRWAECVRAGGLMARMGARGRGGAIHLSTKTRIWRRVHECELQSLEATRNFACWASLQLIFRAASGGSWWGAHTVVVGSGAGSGGLSGAVTHAVVDARGHLQLLRPAVLHRTCGGGLTMRSYPLIDEFGDMVSLSAWKLSIAIDVPGILWAGRALPNPNQSRQLAP